MGSSKTSPLEWLTAQAGVNYLSDLRPDLRPPQTLARLRAALAVVPVDDWSAGQWSEAASYLFDQHLTFSTGKAAVDFLMQKLN